MRCNECEAVITENDAKAIGIVEATNSYHLDIVITCSKCGAKLNGFLDLINDCFMIED